MPIHKLKTVDGFVVLDLGTDAPSTGVVRVAEKVLTITATEIARCTTYAYASLGMPRGGASAGVNAATAHRAAAVEAFVAELGATPELSSYFPDAGKGVEPSDLQPLRLRDPRVDIDESALVGAAALAALDALHFDLADARVAIEGITHATAPLIARLNDQGARIVAVSNEKGSARDDAGFDPVALTDVLSVDADQAIARLTDDPMAPNRLFGVDADVLFVGSHVGVVTDRAADYVKARAIVPIGPSPLTAKAFATLQRSGVVMVPDFVVLAAPLAAAWQHADPVGAVRDIMHEVADHEDGVYLAACYRAEAFLATWQQPLPFGRPFAG